PQTLTAGVTSGTITVQRQDAFNNPTTSGALTVFLSSSSGGGVFRNTADNATITRVSIAPGASSGSFKYKDSLGGNPTITAADQASGPDTGLTDATQTETVNVVADLSITKTDLKASVDAGAADTYTIVV